MIDLHSHILPGIDDGAKDIATSVEMARMAVADGTTVLACTPHILEPHYRNDTEIIERTLSGLREVLARENIPLQLVAGADIHISHDLLDRLRDGSAPTLNKSRYFLFEPPHHVMPPGIVEFCRHILGKGYVPVLTHPERLTWVDEKRYSQIEALDRIGVAIQLTGGSITGNFGKNARYWSERMLKEGRVDIVASDAHDTKHRTTVLSRARAQVVEWCGEETAERLFEQNSRRILDNQELLPKTRRKAPGKKEKKGLLSMFERFQDR